MPQPSAETGNKGKDRRAPAQPRLSVLLVGSVFYSNPFYFVTRASRWHRRHSAQKDNPAERLSVSPESCHVRIQSTQRSLSHEGEDVLIWSCLLSAGPGPAPKVNQARELNQEETNGVLKRALITPSQRWDPATRRGRRSSIHRESPPPTRPRVPPPAGPMKTSESTAHRMDSSESSGGFKPRRQNPGKTYTYSSSDGAHSSRSWARVWRQTLHC